MLVYRIDWLREEVKGDITMLTIKKLVGTDHDFYDYMLQLRHQVFVDEQGYPVENVKNEYDPSAVHFVAFKNDCLIATVSLHIRQESLPLPCEKHTKLQELSDKRAAEMAKLVVTKEYRSKPIALYIMTAAYDYLIEHKISHIFVWTLARMNKSLMLYEKFGFKTVREFEIFGTQRAILKMLDIGNDAVYDTAKVTVHSRVANAYRRYMKQ